MPYHPMAQLFLPDAGYLCRLTKDYNEDFDYVEMCQLDPRLVCYHEQVDPPFLFIWAVQLAGSGYEDNYLLDHPSINQCCRVWANIFHQRSDMGTIENGPPDPTLHPKTTKRVLRSFPAIDFSLFVYTSR